LGREVFGQQSFASYKLLIFAGQKKSLRRVSRNQNGREGEKAFKNQPGPFEAPLKNNGTRPGKAGGQGLKKHDDVSKE